MPEGPPPWWPEGEPWRRRRPPLWWLVVPILVVTVCSVSEAAGHRGFSPLLWMVPLMWLAPFLIIVLLVRFGRMRRFPIRDLVEASSRLAEGDYSARVEPAPGGPMQRIIDSFNGMASRLQDSSEQRRRMMADLGHELRTPLTVIQGEIEAMADGVRPRDDETLARLLEETKLMGRLLEDLRTLSLSESGELRLQMEVVEMKALLEEAVEPFTEERSIAVESDPGTVRCDPYRLRQVISNLMANAVRATEPTGQVRVVARRGEGWTVKVIDDGRGIPPDRLEAVFDRFAKASDSGGSGLGLSIARDLVAAHGGSITAHSEPGQGTIVEFTLP